MDAANRDAVMTPGWESSRLEPMGPEADPASCRFFREGFLMLVLTRKTDEAICIGDSIRVTVLDVRGNKVRIGIDAPANVRIERGELRARGAFDFLEIEASLPIEAPTLCG